MSGHIAYGSNTAKFHGGEKNQNHLQIRELVMVVVGWSGMITSRLKQAYIERHQILIRSETKETQIPVNK